MENNEQQSSGLINSIQNAEMFSHKVPNYYTSIYEINTYFLAKLLLCTFNIY